MTTNIQQTPMAISASETACEQSFSKILTGQQEHNMNRMNGMDSSMVLQPKTCNIDCSPKELAKQRVRRYRKSRPRRRRKGKLHKAGLADQNGNSWRYNIGAPRNDNEFLLNQSKWQLDPKSGTYVFDLSCPTPPQEVSYPIFNVSSPLPFSGTTPGDCIRESDPETAFPYATSDDELETCPICHGMEMRKDSGIDSDCDTMSDYTSSPNHRHACLPNEMSSLNIHSSSDQDTVETEVGGPDLSFLERNFEAEYEDNLMTVLHDCSKEELVTRCRELMDRVKELETGRAKSSPAK